ncbi:hypothetical protein [Nostocoides sp. HKS02]|uniref:hypothetical protein n=1 Tax=Nostocoides sp. HKS02 TaxID=1813880 RepID=UPI001E4DB262|nr:hypothetical protein [Tetrasphaera sp. HKS02]
MLEKMKRKTVEMAIELVTEGEVERGPEEAARLEDLGVDEQGEPEREGGLCGDDEEHVPERVADRLHEVGPGQPVPGEQVGVVLCADEVGARASGEGVG